MKMAAVQADDISRSQRILNPVEINARAHGGDDDFDANDIERQLNAGVERLHTILSRSVWLNDVSAGHNQRLFCALSLLAEGNHSLKMLISAFPAGSNDFSVDDITAVMANLGYYVAEKRGPVDGIPLKKLPVLFMPENDAPMVVFKDYRSGQLMAYYGTGRIHIIGPEDKLSGRFFAFKVNSDTQPLSKTRRSHTKHSWFRALLTKFSGIGKALLLVSLALGTASIMLPVFTIQIYGEVIALGTLTPLPYFIVGLAMVVVLELSLMLMRTHLLAWVSSRIDFLASISSFDRILKVKPSVSERAAVTDQAARLRTVESVREFIIGPMSNALLDVPVTIAALTVIFVLGKWLVVVPMIGIACHLGLFFLLRKRIRIMTSIAADESTEMQRLAIETFEKNKLIRQSGLHYLWANKLIRNARREQKAQLFLRFFGAVGEALSTFIFTVSTVMLLAGGAQLAWAEAIGSGGLLAIVILGFRALGPFHVLCLSVQRIEQLRNSVNQLNSLMDLPPEHEEEREYSHMDKIHGEITFINAGFRGTDTRPVFVGLDLEIEPGEVIGITGSNGSGKTTILKILMGMADFSLGTIRLDQVDIRQLPLDEVRSRISYVPQYPKLFAGSLRENLLLVDPLATEERIAKTLRIVGLEQAIAALPDGLDHEFTLAEQDMISTEFRFKFAFAQAVLTDSNLLLIDEIPNNLMDTSVGELVKNLITSLSGKRTILFVSHRSDFLELADRVIGLRYGKIPVITKPQALMERVA